MGISPNFTNHQWRKNIVLWFTLKLFWHLRQLGG